MKQLGATARTVSLSTFAGAVVLLAPATGLGATFVVNTSADTAGTACPGSDGNCSLRQAIAAANASPGADLITFAIGSGAVTIQPSGGLPQITRAVTIDGTTQPGYAGTPLVTLSGASAGSNPGLLLNSTESVTVRGLNLQRYGSSAAIHVYNTGGAIIAGNRIGTSADGTSGAGCLIGVRVENGGGNPIVIGGAGEADRNLISGCAYGIYALGTASGGLVVQNNYVGTNASGTAALSSNGNSGIEIERSSVPSQIIGNLVSGAGSVGIKISGSANNRIEGNFIGVNASGTAAIANAVAGVAISDFFVNTTRFAATGNVIGGTTASARNVISGNGQTGVALDGDTIVIGNYIGTNAAGTAGIPNRLRGIEAHGARNRIGGRTAAERNVISGGHGEMGVYLVFSTAVDNVVEGNFIGTDASGVNPLGNAQGGVWINTQTAGGNVIGGTAAGAGNLIAFNGGSSGFNDGIFVLSGVNNAFLGNSIHSNGGLAIDLDPNGLDANDALDADTGPNNKQNHPLVASTSRGAGTLAVQGTLSSAASTEYRIEVFANDACDASGSGEARYFLGAVNVTTDANGQASWSGTFASPAGNVITVTATDPAGNTSEVSPCVTAPLPDADADGVPDASDNCPTTPNPNQADTDGDGQGDACDAINDERCVDASFPDGLPLAYRSTDRHAFSADFGGAFEVVYRVRFASEFAASDTFDSGERYFVENFGGQGSSSNGRTSASLSTFAPSTLADAQDGRLSGFYTSEIGEFTLTRFQVCATGRLAPPRNTCATASFTPALPAALTAGQERSFTVSFGRTFDRLERISMISSYAATDTFDTGERYSVTGYGGQQLTGGNGQTRMELNTVDPTTLARFLDGQHAGTYRDENGSFTLTRLVFCVQEPAPPDADGDGVTDAVDNCRNTPNADQADRDGDAIGDACDPEDDANCTDAVFASGLPRAFTTNTSADWSANFGRSFARVTRLRMISLYSGADTLDGGETYFIFNYGGQTLTGATGQVRAELNTEDPITLATVADGLIDGFYVSEAGNFTLTRLIFCATEPQIIDDDGDGIANADDNCPAAANPDQADSDGDGRGDACDACPYDAANDLDGDGVCGDVDNCPGAANGSQADTDGDGRGDACDACPADAANDLDGDGVCGDVDNCPGAANGSQADADGDGRGDACDACPYDAANDLDGDGVCGDVDNCPGAANGGQADADGDGRGDACDACPYDAANDLDGDGVCGDVDNCATVANASQADTDGDGRGDACDACPRDALNDLDGDGLCADVDACPFDPANDADGDGLCAGADNCPTVYNPSQADLGGNGVGDLCEPAICEVAQRACVKDYEIASQACRDRRSACAATCTTRACKDACKSTMDTCLATALAAREACLADQNCVSGSACTRAAQSDMLLCGELAMEDGFECRQACATAADRAACIGACVTAQRSDRQACNDHLRAAITTICQAPFACTAACLEAERVCKDDANAAAAFCQAGCDPNDALCNAACLALRDQAWLACDVAEASCTLSCN